MAFWGIEVKPGKPYIYMHFGERGRLRISQAILGTGTRSSSERSIVECHVENKDPVYICSLEPERTETCPLNLEFDEYNLVMFKAIGPCSVHLSGFFFGESKNTFTIISEDETDSNGSNGYDTEDKHGDGVIDDDLDIFRSSPVAGDGVTKETPNDEKPSNKKGISKQPKKKNQLSASYNGNSQRQNVVKGGTGVPVLESEDEDGFPISYPHQSNADVLIAEGKEAEVEDNKTDEEPEQKKAKDDTCSLKSLKRKVHAIVQNGEEARKTVQLVDSSLATTEEVTENNKRKKKNKKKKLEGQEEKTFEVGTGSRSCTQTEEATTLDIDQALPSGKEHDEKLTTHKSIDVDADSTAEENHSERKKKKKGKSKKQESGVNANMEQTITGENRSTMEIEDRTEAKPFQVRTFSNGLIIEELAMGKPDGKRASPGKKVGVHYIGKLKKNGKIFDSNVGRAPFKFRLGVGQVIKGWDVGVNGMRVGDKRRLTIPPAMGYGAQGAGGAIPPNSWLLFDVELVDVR